MFKNTIFRRMTALVLTLALAAAAALPGLAVYPMPIQTASETEAVYLFNADTGKTILNQNAGQQQYVASLTKLMTALLLLESGKDLNGEVTVPTALTQEFRDIQNANLRRKDHAAIGCYVISGRTKTVTVKHCTHHISI